MAKSGSERRKKDLEELDLNLNPMMDMFSVLIPTLLMLSAAFEIAVINVSTPSIGPSGDDSQQPQDEPLNLTVTITEDGYRITAKGLQVAGDPNDPTKPSVPLIQKTFPCTRYRGTVPPPRKKNLNESAACPESAAIGDKRQFWSYNTEALAAIAIQLKDEHPSERRVIIAAVPTIDFEPLVEVMDSMREVKEASGNLRTLFDEVVVSPAAF